MSLIFMLLACTGQAEVLRQKLICTISSEEWCATIPKGAFQFVNRSEDICIFKFIASIYNSKVDLDMTIRTKNRDLNYRSTGPSVSTSLKLQNSIRAIPFEMLNFSSQDRSVTVSISNTINSRSSLAPFAYIRRPTDLVGSYGNGFNCAEIGSDGQVRNNYYKSTAE